MEDIEINMCFRIVFAIVCDIPSLIRDLGTNGGWMIFYDAAIISVS